MIRATLLLLLVALPGILTGCRSTPQAGSLQRFEYKHPAMGTLFLLTLYAPDQTIADPAAGAAFDRIDALEDIMSDYQADSELMRLCEQPPGKPVPVSADLFEALRQSERISELSGGAFDVTVGPYVRLWRFARKRKVLPSSTEVATARKAVGFRNLHLDARTRSVTLLVPNMRLDLGGIAKGYAADQALALLKSRGIGSALVAASGDIAIGDPPPGRRGWNVGITSIDERSNHVSRTVVLRNAGISTSGDTEQFIEIGGIRYSHILNPATGLGLTNRIQATVIAPNATTTDGMATTVCVLGPQRGIAEVDKLPHAAALVLVKEGGQVQRFVSKRFPQTSVATETEVRAAE